MGGNLLTATHPAHSTLAIEREAPATAFGRCPGTRSVRTSVRSLVARVFQSVTFDICDPAGQKGIHISCARLTTRRPMNMLDLFSFVMPR